MAAAHDVEALLSQLGSKLRFAKDDETSRPLPLDWTELDAALPDGGLPHGVVELAAPGALAGATSVALAAVRAGQARGRAAWCAWIDPEGTLHAPGVVAAGVDPARMLVVRAPRGLVANVAVKVVGSGAFEVVVVDVDAIRGAPSSEATRARGQGWAGHALSSGRRPGDGPKGTLSADANGGVRGARVEVVVRKLALAAEPTGATVLLLTDSTRPRATPWPVALRLELARPDARTLAVRVAKDRRGRVGGARTISFQPESARPSGFGLEHPTLAG